MKTDQTLNSKWWYGIASTVGLGVISYMFISIILFFDVQYINSDTELIALVFSVFGLFIAGILVLVLTIVFVLCFVIDWKRINDAEIEWNPSPAYLLIPAVSLVNFVRPVIVLPIITVGAGYYLYQRSVHTGIPTLRFLP
jgi:ABC-type multidrug transport system fused ATPase/permease subunit